METPDPSTVTLTVTVTDHQTGRADKAKSTMPRAWLYNRSKLSNDAMDALVRATMREALARLTGQVQA